MDNDRFQLNTGRKRPQYQPKNITCPNCGSGFSIKSEQSELVICEYCGSHIQISQAEQKVLGKGSGQKVEFPLNLGDSFRFRGSRYEIIGRLAFIEDGDMSEITREYLLFNPRQGPIWIDEYQGQYDLSTTSHVMPKSDVLSANRGDTLATYDGRKWICEETGEYELYYVDGALPWVAKIGDRVQYAEFVEKSGGKLAYSVQRINNEVEFSTGQTLPIEQVRSCFKKPDLGKGQGRQPRANAAQKQKTFKRMIFLAIIALLINVGMIVYSVGSGSTLHSESFSAAQISDEVYSDSFEITHNNEVIKIIIQTNLNNAWMNINFAVVKDNESVIHVDDQEISYYHGSSGGESWSEGSRKGSMYFIVPQKGTYKLLINAVSAKGNANTANRAEHDVKIIVKAGAYKPTYAIIMTVISGIILFVLMFSYSAWKGGE